MKQTPCCEMLCLFANVKSFETGVMGQGLGDLDMYVMYRGPGTGTGTGTRTRTSPTVLVCMHIQYSTVRTACRYHPH
jgi:hypothetical protein